MSRAITLLIGLPFALLSGSVHAIESRIIDNTPSVPSICQITPNSKIAYGQVVEVISPSGATEKVVFDQNYEDEFASLFSEKKAENRKLFFTVWFAEGILFTAHQPDLINKNNWTASRLYGTSAEYGTGDRFSYFIKVGESLYPIEMLDLGATCKYGAEEVYWHHNVSGSIALKFSDEAKTALQNAQSSEKVAIVYQRKDSNRTYETTTAIGSGTITAWKQFAIAPSKKLKKG